MRPTIDVRRGRTPKLTFAVALAASSALLGWIGCSSLPGEEPLGVARIAVTNVPSDVACIRVTAAGDITVETLLDVSPGESSVYSLDGLPLGTVSFTGDAFPSICAVVSAGTMPSWVSDPVLASVTASAPVTVSLQMHPNGQANVGVDFDDAGCHANGAPCLSGGECCTGQCASGECCTPLGDPCAANIDCCTGLCNAGVCQPVPGCTANGGACMGDAECCNSSCYAGICQSPPSCQPAGGPCLAPTDCCAGICVSGVCEDASCNDGIQNQGETGVDCGGPCAPCPTCSDGIQNQGEHGIDCGGPCAACPPICVTIVRGGVYTVADTYLASTSPNANFGSATQLVVNSTSQSLMQFDLSGIPAGSMLTAATLKIRTISGTGALVTIHNILAPWIEPTVTYASFGNASSPAVMASFNATNGAHSVDVLSLVQAWVSGFTPNYGFLFKSSATSTISSSEAANSKPSLFVCYVP